MKWIIIFTLSSLLCQPLYAGIFDGLYTYSKGINKAYGEISIAHFSADSAFFILQCVSGMPDFSNEEMKGFMQVDSNRGVYHKNDSCSVMFIFSKKRLDIQTKLNCTFSFSPAGKYTLKNTTIAKGVNYLPAFTERRGRTKTDSIPCLQAPHTKAKFVCWLTKSDEFYIVDEYSGYYLVTTKTKKKEFLWVSKKEIALLKTK